MNCFCPQCVRLVRRIERRNTLLRPRARCMITSCFVVLTSRISECWTMFPLYPMTRPSCRCLCLRRSARAVRRASSRGNTTTRWLARHLTSSTTRWLAFPEEFMLSLARPVSCLRKPRWSWHPSPRLSRVRLAQEWRITPIKWKTKVFALG